MDPRISSRSLRCLVDAALDPTYEDAFTLLDLLRSGALAPDRTREVSRALASLLHRLDHGPQGPRERRGRTVPRGSS